jgi:hypothetical protein
MPTMARSQYGSKFNIRRQPVYDSRTIVTAKAQTYNFFTTPYGQSEDGINKTKFDTNQQVAGQMPASMPFLLTSISLMLWSPSPIIVEDTENVILNAKAYFLFQINQVNVLECPIQRLGQDTGPYNSGTTASVPALTNGLPNRTNVFDFGKRAVEIGALVPFTISLQYFDPPTVVGPSGGIGGLTGIRMFIVLNGAFAQPKNALNVKG